MADRTALAWALAVALGLALCAAGCEGPGLEPPYMSGAAGSTGGGAGGAAGGGGNASGAGKGGSAGSAGKPPVDRMDAGTPTSGTGDAGFESEDGGSDEDAGTR